MWYSSGAPAVSRASHRRSTTPCSPGPAACRSMTCAPTRHRLRGVRAQAAASWRSARRPPSRRRRRPCRAPPRTRQRRHHQQLAPTLDHRLQRSSHRVEHTHQVDVDHGLERLGSISSTDPTAPIPALAITMSIRRIARCPCPRPPASPTAHDIGDNRQHPILAEAVATSLSWTSSRSVNTSFAPLAWRRRATSAPIPFAPPLSAQLSR